MDDKLLFLPQTLEFPAVFFMLSSSCRHDPSTWKIFWGILRYQQVLGFYKGFWCVFFVRFLRNMTFIDFRYIFLFYQWFLATVLSVIVGCVCCVVPSFFVILNCQMMSGYCAWALSTAVLFAACFEIKLCFSLLMAHLFPFFYAWDSL